MDVLRDSSLSERSLSPKQPGLEQRDGFVSGSGCSEPVVQKSEITEAAQKAVSEVSMGICDSKGVEDLKIVGDGSAKDSNFESAVAHNLEGCLESTNGEAMQQKEVAGDENDEKRSTEKGIISEFACLGNDEQSLEDVAFYSTGEQMRLVQEDPISKSIMDGNGAMISASENLGSATGDVSENLGLQPSEPTCKDAVDTAGEAGLDKGTPAQSRKRKPKLVPPVSNRFLRSRSQEKSKASEAKGVEVEDTANEEGKGKRRKKRCTKKIPANEFSRIRTHLRYLLNRIKYEQNLIDAYSGEGWKGQSLEKIKPEKELQRAKSQIFRYKLKIRDLFQHLDTSLTQGKLPASLFDSEGQIDSEDIFCAKCGSKDLTVDNDIILCDGACERGFHQFCLEPPLLKKDIPPGDEGWLCPGCDCKVDCVEILNGFWGSNLSVLDNWEKVFPEEAAAAASGKKMDDNFELPSDDSEDDDYNPDSPEMDHTVSGAESSSDESDYFSASDNVMPSLDNNQPLGLQSDDSEDDDFDPCASDDDQHASSESSSSDFTSDSEDLHAIIDEENLPGQDEGMYPYVSDQNKPDAGSSAGKLRVGKVNRQSLSDELAYLLESDPAPVSGKRHVEKLDYKKLHDETFGDATSDSSDEEYGETAGRKRRKNSVGKSIPQSINEVRDRNNGTDAEDGNDDQKENEHKPVGENHRNLEVKSSNNIFVESQRSASRGGFDGRNANRPYKRLGEAAVQRLLESFKENQYPKQGLKEILAKELGLRVQQVSKWFENARFSFRHSSRMESKIAGSAPSNGTLTPQMNEKVTDLEPESVLENPSCNGVEKVAPSLVSPGEEEGQHADMGEGQSATDASEQKSGIHKPRKRKSKAGDPALDHLSNVETPNQEAHVHTPEFQAIRRSGRIHAKNSN